MRPAKSGQQGFYKLTWLAAMAFATATLLLPQAAAAQSCLAADEAAAERVRRLQTTLMIGALQCRHRKDLGVADLYNDIVQGYGPVIAAQDRILTRYFQRAHGSGYRQAMDRHVTSMANVIARAAQHDGAFCESVAKLGQELLSSNAPDIAERAQRVALIEIDIPKSCAVSRPLTAGNLPEP